jgi:hypothetical protein
LKIWFDGLATLERSLEFRFLAVYVIMVGPKCELSADAFDVMSFDNIYRPSNALWYTRWAGLE